MGSRGRYNRIPKDWDPMQEDYNDTMYDPQYDDGDVNGRVQLDHHKLYVTNINKALNADGLRTAFSKYANNVRIFMSKDPDKRYAIVTFETTGEAKHAMMKLNKTEPLRLHISFAHKKKYTHGNYQANNRDESTSSSSKGRSSRKQEEHNGDNSQDFCVDDADMDSEQDCSDLDELELKYKYYSLQAETIKCKQRLSKLYTGKKPSPQNPVSNRSVFPDGLIVVKNTERHPPTDNAFSSAAGDSSLPALQHHQRQRCLWCDFPADLYCGRCGVAPYCSPRCQQSDWLKRHRDICHNLLRVRAGALRRPHSPANRNRDDNSDGTRKNFHPAGQKVNRNSNFKNYNNIRRPNVQNNKNQREEEELFTFKAPQETKPAEKNPAQEEKPLQEDQPPLIEKPLRRPAQAPLKRSLTDHVAAKLNTKPAAAPATLPTVMPKSYLLDTLSPGDTGILSVESDAASCKGKSGFICLTLHENSGEDYEKLCNDYLEDCEKDESYTPKPGELFSFKNPEDDSWYRARCLNKLLCALIDSAKLVDLSAGSACKKITPKYENIPEFCCELNAKGIKIGDNLKYTIISKSGSTCKVSLENIETNAEIGEGEINRWKPKVDIPVSTPAIPEVRRPDLKDNSRVFLVDCSSCDKTFIRPADTESIKKFDMVLNDTLESAINATPIKEPPMKGQTVIAKFTDGLWYRALVKRTNESQNKYLLEYAEYGNIEISQRENIVSCPLALTLDQQPTVVSRGNLKVTTSSLTEAATEYLQNIRDSETELILTTTDGSRAAPSGSDINLTVAKNKESINKKLVELCTPEWKKLEVRGGDVIDTPRLMFSELTYPSLPNSGCELLVLDTTLLEVGVISGCQRLPGTELALENLEKKLAEYCNSELGKQPYLPAAEELCVAQCPPYEQWFRAVLCEQVDGPGGSELQVCYIDYGNLATVPVSVVRKMLPEFVEGTPAMALQIEIRGFPKKPSTEILMKALLHMKVNKEGRGSLQVVSCVKLEAGTYMVDAPELLEAIKC